MENRNTITEMVFNPLDDFASMKKLMENHKEYPTMLIGRNENGETTELHILSDHILLVTYQNNHWIRKNYYWEDGTTEELFKGKWE